MNKLWKLIKCLFGQHDWVEIDRDETPYSPNLFYVQFKCMNCGERTTKFFYTNNPKQECQYLRKIENKIIKK